MDHDAKFPTVSPEHTIDREAKAIVDRMLARDWLLHRIVEHDYGRDYLVEAIIDGQPSGKMFHAQLKGTRGASFDANGRLSWSLESRHLRYYYERVDQPVFLFVVDVTAEQGWFCFVQGEIASSDAQAKLAHQSSLTLHLRLDNALADRARLLAALDQACAFIREKNPGSLTAAFRAAAKAHEQIDPNFAVVRAEIKNGHTCLHVAPKAPFSFSIHVSGPKAASITPKIGELFRYGRPLELTTDDVEFDGFPLFARAKADGLRGHFAFTPGDLLLCEIVVSAGKRNPFALTLTGKISRGTEGGLIVGELRDAPLGIEIRVSLERLRTKRSASIELTWDLNRWIGKPLATLPQIEPISAFWDALVRGTEIDITINQNGNRLTRGHLGRTRLPDRYDAQHRLCTMLRKAREVAITLGRKTVVPNAETLVGFNWDDIDIAHDLVQRGEYRRNAPNLRLWLDLYPESDKFTGLFKDQSEISGHVRVEHRPYAIEAFGETWELGDAFCETGPIKCRRAAGEDGKPRGEIRGQKGTVLRIAKLPPETSTPELPSD